MAVYGQMVLTTQGQALYAKAQTGTTLNFTRMQIGGGQLASGQDPTTLKALITPIAYFNINSESANGNTSSVKGIFENTNITSSTYSCELGLFAQDPTAGEILYAYANAASQGDTIPPFSAGPLSKQYQINVAIGNASSVTANVPSNTYIPTTQLGVANGVATLDGTGKVPSAQLPVMNYIPTSAEGVANGVATLDGSGYVPKAQLGNGVTSVNSKTGAVSLAASDVSAIATSVLTTAGDILYASGANTPARLGVGTNGQVLTASGGLPTWQALPASGAWTKISETTLATTSATILLNSIPQTYKALKLLIKGFCTDNTVSATTIYMSMNDGATNGFYYVYEGSVSTTNQDNMGSYAITPSFATKYNSGGISQTEVTILNYADTSTNKTFNADSADFSGTQMTTVTSAGAYLNQNAVTQIKLSLGIGSFGVGTKIILLGLN